MEPSKYLEDNREEARRTERERAKEEGSPPNCGLLPESENF